jgi:hypothetical protein
VPLTVAGYPYWNDGLSPPAFFEAYRKAEATAEEKAIKAIYAAFPDDWRAAVTYLERRYPSRWARRQNVDVTGKGQPMHAIEVVRTVRAGEAPRR